MLQRPPTRAEEERFRLREKLFIWNQVQGNPENASNFIKGTHSAREKYYAAVVAGEAQPASHTFQGTPTFSIVLRSELPAVINLQSEAGLSKCLSSLPPPACPSLSYSMRVHSPRNRRWPRCSGCGEIPEGPAGVIIVIIGSVFPSPCRRSRPSAQHLSVRI